MNLQDHVISVTLTGGDSWFPSRPNKRHHSIFFGRRIGSLKLTEMSDFSSLVVLLLSVISPNAGWGWVLLKFQLINENTLIITLLLFAPKNNPSIHFLIIRVRGHWVRGWNPQIGQDIHFSLSAYSRDLLWSVMILKCWTTRFSLENLLKRLLLTLSDWCSISDHLFCWVVPAGCLYIPDVLWGAVEVLGFLNSISSADRAGAPPFLSVRPCGVIPISRTSPHIRSSLALTSVDSGRFVPLIGGPQL